MYSGTGFSLKGLRHHAPVNTPRFSSDPSEDSRSTSLVLRAFSTKASTAARCSSLVTDETSGCSGASTAYVIPKLVSGRVVKTSNDGPSGWLVPSAPQTCMANSAPSERPIQLRCIVSTRSGQSSPSRSSSSSWA